MDSLIIKFLFGFFIIIGIVIVWGNITNTVKNMDGTVHTGWDRVSGVCGGLALTIFPFIFITKNVYIFFTGFGLLSLAGLFSFIANRNREIEL